MLQGAGGTEAGAILLHFCGSPDSFFFRAVKWAFSASKVAPPWRQAPEAPLDVLEIWKRSDCDCDLLGFLLLFIETTDFLILTFSVLRAGVLKWLPALGNVSSGLSAPSAEIFRIPITPNVCRLHLTLGGRCPDQVLLSKNFHSRPGWWQNPY